MCFSLILYRMNLYKMNLYKIIPRKMTLYK